MAIKPLQLVQNQPGNARRNGSSITRNHDGFYNDPYDMPGYDDCYGDHNSDDIQEFHDSVYRESQEEERKDKLKKIALAVGAIALTAAAITFGVAESLRLPKFVASDEIVTLEPGDNMYKDKDVELANEWNADHRRKIEPAYVAYAIDEINGIKDEDGDGIADTPQPGDSFILPEFIDE